MRHKKRTSHQVGKVRKGDIMKLRDKILYMSYGAGLVVLVVYMVMEVMVVVLFY